MEILENSLEDTPVGNFTVTDADAEASISFEILQSTCSEGTPGTNVTGWVLLGAELRRGVCTRLTKQKPYFSWVEVWLQKYTDGIIL